MSKLAEAIRRSQRVESAPMGFGAVRTATKPSMLVGYYGAAGGVEAAVAAGAELIIVEGDLSDDEAKKASGAAGDLSVGVAAKSLGVAKVREMHEAGIDFIAFEPDKTPSSALLNEDISYVMVLPHAPEELFLRTLDTLTLEALLLTSVSSGMTVSQQIELNRIGMLARKPLICVVDSKASKEDLECLRAAGVTALLVSKAEDLSQLKETVAVLPPKRKPRDDQRTVVSLPRSAAVHEHDDDEDE